VGNFLRRSIGLTCVVLVACAAPIGRKDLLDFLEDGVSRREDIRLKLGEPSAEYEDSRVLAYRLRKDDAGYVLVGRRDSWYGIQYNLMLAFDGDGVLRRHSLVEIRSP
jgi:hypothetical protein